jgi:uncharacterized protein (TIGR03437 family)
VKDSAGVDRIAPLFYVGPSQINYVVPGGLANGPATLSVVRGGRVAASGSLEIAPVSPGLFAANADGKGAPAGITLTVTPNGARSIGYTYQCGNTPGSCVTAPINASGAAGQVFAVLFGTGIRGRSSNPTVTIGGIPAEVSYAGSQGELVGLDQVNVLLPGALAGRGEVEIRLTVDGREANALKLNVK